MSNSNISKSTQDITGSSHFIMKLRTLLNSTLLSTAPLRVGEMQIKGTGRLNADLASMDIHIDIINRSNTHPSATQPILSESPPFFKVKDDIAVNAAASFTRKRAFGVETGKM